MQPKACALRSMLLFGLVLAGCGGPSLPSAHNITGKVTFEGKPLPNVMVAFDAIEGIPAGYRSKMATTEPDGSFKIDEVYEAEYSVSIVPTANIDVENSDADPNAGGNPGDAPAVMKKSPLDRYADGTLLKVTVAEDNTNFDFPLTAF